jgi:integrase
LRWEAIDLDALTLRVERSWDASSRQCVRPKSKAGTRTVPIIDRLAVLLADHRVLTNHPAAGLPTLTGGRTHARTHGDN